MRCLTLMMVLSGFLTLTILYVVSALGVGAGIAVSVCADVEMVALVRGSELAGSIEVLLDRGMLRG